MVITKSTAVVVSTVVLVTADDRIAPIPDLLYCTPDPLFEIVPLFVMVYNVPPLFP